MTASPRPTPSSSSSSLHKFEKHHFSSPRWCNSCEEFIWGIGKQGYKCTVCKYSAHKKCLEHTGNCGGIPLPKVKPSLTPSSSSNAPKRSLRQSTTPPSANAKTRPVSRSGSTTSIHPSFPSPSPSPSSSSLPSHSPRAGGGGSVISNSSSLSNPASSPSNSKPNSRSGSTITITKSGSFREKGGLGGEFEFAVEHEVTEDTETLIDTEALDFGDNSGSGGDEGGDDEGDWGCADPSDF